MQAFSDGELVNKAQTGEQEALEELIRRYFRQIFLFAKTFVHDDLEAEDITQEVFVKLWKNLARFERGKNFKTWLFKIAKNTSIDFLRKHKIIFANEIQEELMANSLENLVDETPLPQEVFDQAGYAQKFDEILSSLAANHRLVLTLHLQQDLSFQEISDVLNEPLNTVKSRYRRALLKIKQDLGGAAPKKQDSSYN